LIRKALETMQSSSKAERQGDPRKARGGELQQGRRGG